MISSYRLGDLILVNLTETEKNEILNEHPNSIGSKFILEKRKNKKDSNIDIITKIVLEHLQQISHLLPSDISDSTLIHLRLGDVVAGSKSHEKKKRPIKKEYLKFLLKNDNNKKYVMGACFFAKPSSTNYEECIEMSNIYLQNVIDELGAEYFNSGDPDIDLCCAIKSKLFLQGRGFFSKLIVEIRKKLHLPNIETSCQD